MCRCDVSCAVAMVLICALSECGVCCALCLQSCLPAFSLAHPPQYLPAALMAFVLRLPSLSHCQPPSSRQPGVFRKVHPEASAVGLPVWSTGAQSPHPAAWASLISAATALDARCGPLPCAVPFQLCSWKPPLTTTWSTGSYLHM